MRTGRGTRGAAARHGLAEGAQAAALPEQGVGALEDVPELLPACGGSGIEACCLPGRAACSEAAVNPTRSQNNTDTTLRSSNAGVGAVSASGAAHSLQNFAFSGFSLPQTGQVATRRV
jgi:hypothetical protein